MARRFVWAATACLVLWMMMVGQSSGASKCYDDCYSTCLLRRHDESLQCQLLCLRQCGGGATASVLPLLHSCEASCASHLCSNQNPGVAKPESCVEGCSKLCKKRHLLP